MRRRGTDRARRPQSFPAGDSSPLRCSVGYVRTVRRLVDGGDAPCALDVRFGMPLFSSAMAREAASAAAAAVSAPRPAIRRIRAHARTRTRHTQGCFSEAGLERRAAESDRLSALLSAFVAHATGRGDEPPGSAASLWPTRAVTFDGTRLHIAPM
jgi:hypothetical protein